MNNVATTPQSNEGLKPSEGGTTPLGQEGAITPNVIQGEATSPKEVEELKGQVEDLTKKLEGAQNLQSQADKKTRVAEIERQKLEVRLEKIRSGEISPDEDPPAGETSTERELRLEARIAIQNLILGNAKYQEVLEKDITLKEILKKNPLALIDKYLDAQDAAEQIQEKLDKRVTSLETQPNKEEPKEGEGKKFDMGLIQPGETPPTPPEKPKGSVPLDNIEESIKSRINIT